MSDLSHDHELRADFQSEVLERSHEVPVLVDFWAAWCGPCRVLGPVLEDLASRAGGAWELVKVDTERWPELARDHGIQGIPAVKLFSRGQVIGEFTGALGEAQVAMWLQQHLPGPGDDAWARAQALLDADGVDADAARAALEEVLRQDPGHDRAHLEMARLLVGDDPAAARTHLESITGDADAYAAAQHLLHLAGVVEWARGEAPPPGGGGDDPHTLALYREGAVAFGRNDPATALEKWVEVVGLDRELDDDGARKACIALFGLLGEDHPLTRDWRRRFSMALSG